MRNGIVFGMIVTLCLAVKIYGYAEELPKENPYQTVIDSMTEDDYEALREVIYWESARAGCDYRVNVAVAEVVMNRVLSDDPFYKSDTVYGICHQKGQFYRKPLPKTADLEPLDDAINTIVTEGLTVNYSTQFTCFATKKQSIAYNHRWIGDVDDNGCAIKGTGMWFGILKGK